jgi:large subunit ribosomal protein L21
MYAVIKTGGKQHKVKPGDVIEVELIHSSGDTVTFTPLLVVDDEGATHFGKEASKAKVTAKLVGEQKGDKVKIFKYRPKTGYAKRAGHRQMYTLIEIQDVSLGGAAKKSAAPEKAPKPEKTEKPAKAEKSAKPAADAAPSEQPDAEDIGAVTEAGAEDATDGSAGADGEAEAAEAGAPEA